MGARLLCLPRPCGDHADAARSDRGNDGADGDGRQPPSLHTSGRAGRRVVEESRETIAQALGARPSEVLFTSGGTESDNLAIKGLFWARRDADPRRVRLL